MPISSASGVLALLSEPSFHLKEFGLKKLLSPYTSENDRGLSILDVFWPEISEELPRIEALYEDPSFKERKLAALAASKVYFHLGSYEDALSFALGAGDLFKVNLKSEYVDVIISKCIDTYTQERVAGRPVDPRQEAIVNQMFARCFEDKMYKHAMGLAVETHRTDIFVEAVKRCEDKDGILTYAFKIIMTFIQNRSYRGELMRKLIDVYKGSNSPDYISMVQCLIIVDDPNAVALVLETLSQGSQDDILMAYQIAFDLYESATQQFLNNVLLAVRKTAPIPIASTILEAAGAKPEAEAPKEGETESVSMEVDPEQTQEVKIDELSPVQKAQQGIIEKLTQILSGEKSIYLHLQFLVRNDKSDMLILKQTKDTVRVAICHTGTVIANGYMHCGTTHDTFLLDNLEWLSRATNWSKFSATASLGVIHRGHIKDSLALMQNYLPKDSSNPTNPGYAEGGCLYALGLIHANHGGSITDYLLKQLKESSKEPIKHGGCLGLGLAAMGTQRADVYEQLKFSLYLDEAVAGEAAGIAMGLVELGSKSETAISDMVAFAQDTQHEKISRGLAVGIALLMYGRLEEADTLIDSLCNDKDAILRRTGMYTIAMAYCGTGSNVAIRRLLHVAVSDVSDDVRRAAVMALGFILFKTPEQVPSLVSLLSESYNPHVRYGAAMALGIACAGTGSKEAIALIEPMTQDPVNFVRQGSLIASALIMVQHTEITCPKVKEFRALYAKVIADKHEDVMAKFGAILSQGIIDAGGRNMTVTLISRTGHTNLLAVVGMLVFTQYWYWFPLSHFLSLAFTPTCLIGLNENLDMPVVQFRSNAKPSTYGYPAPLEEKKKEDKEKVATVVLSITAKQKKKDQDKKKDASEKMDVDDEKKDTEKEKDKKEEEVKKDEPTFEIIDNPARVMKAQLQVTTLEQPAKYKAMKEINIGGIVMMKKITDEPEDLVKPVSTETAEDEPEPPKDFEYTE